MKKIATFIVTITFVTAAFSQWSVNLGGNISQFTGKDVPNNASTKFGYQVGITTYSTNLFSIQPGLFLVNKGAKFKDDATNLNYLQIPVNLMLNFGIDEDWRAIAGAGLYGGLGLFGNVDGDKIEFFNKKDPWKMIDLGWQFVVGAQYGARYGLRLSYQPRSFTKVKGSWNPDKGDYSSKGPKIFNNSFMFTVSYTFGDVENY